MFASGNMMRVCINTKGIILKNHDPVFLIDNKQIMIPWVDIENVDFIDPIANKYRFFLAIFQGGLIFLFRKETLAREQVLVKLLFSQPVNYGEVLLRIVIVNGNSLLTQFTQFLAVGKITNLKYSKGGVTFRDLVYRGTRYPAVDRSLRQEGFRYAQAMGNMLLVLLLAGGVTPELRVPATHPITLAQQRRDGLWRGNGQIISGPGSGGTVTLTLLVEGNRYRSLEGPKIEGEAEGSILNHRGNQWQFQFMGRYLNVTLTRRNGQIINFTLTPDG